MVKPITVVPCNGFETIEYVKASPSTSLPESVIITGVSSLVETEPLLVMGGLFRLLRAL